MSRNIVDCSVTQTVYMYPVFGNYFDKLIVQRVKQMFKFLTLF